MADATPGSRASSGPFSTCKALATASSGRIARRAAREAAPRRLRDKERGASRSRSISSAKCGTTTDSSPRPVATWRHTSGSRSPIRWAQASCTAWLSNTASTPSSPCTARRVASRAARSSRRAAIRRADSEPLEGSISQRWDSSRREMSDSASSSAGAPVPMGTASDSATRARIPAPSNARVEPSARVAASATKVAPVPSCSRSSTRLPSSRRSGPSGSDEARPYSAQAAPGSDRKSRSSIRLAAMAARTLSSSWSGGMPSSGTPRASSVASAKVAML